jgi:hypothetical protein
LNNVEYIPIASVRCEEGKKLDARNRESGYGYRWNIDRKIEELNLKTYVIASSYRILIFARIITNSRIMFARMLLNGLLSRHGSLDDAGQPQLLIWDHCDICR